MRNRWISWMGAAGIALLLLSLTALPMAGQATNTAAKSALPRTPDGHPDLQGTYDLATMTPFERLGGDPPSYTKEKAEALMKAEIARRSTDNKPSSADRPAPPVGGDTTPAKSYFEFLEKAGGGPVGGYNRFWLNQGTTYTIVDGQIRTSIVVDPPDGHVPPYNDKAKKRFSATTRATPTSDQRENANPNAVEAPNALDDPERRPLGERCLLGFGSTSGPPALPDYFYNDLHQIVQTPDSIMILTEMVHDARVVRMNAQHLPKTIRRWMGDSVGHWEGDTLVVDTTNFNDKTRFRNATENLHVIERFTRVGPDTIDYKFTIDDPSVFTRSWTAELPLQAAPGPIYEYACHEGNYALLDILTGARAQEQKAAKTAK